nr:flagellar basal body protein FliL [Rhodospirillales bacterium]
MSESEETVGEGNKVSNKKTIIVMLVLLVAGGGAGYFFIATESTESGVQGTVAESKEPSVNELLYAELKTPLIVNFPKGSSARLIQVSVTLLVKNEETVAALKKHQPMIRNNFLLIISTQGSEYLATRDGKEVLRAEMLEEVGEIMEKMMGKNEVVDLFFTSFVMQ